MTKASKPARRSLPPASLTSACKVVVTSAAADITPSIPTKLMQFPNHTESVSKKHHRGKISFGGCAPHPANTLSSPVPARGTNMCPRCMMKTNRQYVLCIGGLGLHLQRSSEHQGSCSRHH